MRHITSNAMSRIPAETQILMWFMLDSMEEDKDYLQILNLSIKDGNQIIRHHQEYPIWEEEVVLLTDSPVTEKVYIIVENGLETMMLAEDY